MLCLDGVHLQIAPTFELIMPPKLSLTDIGRTLQKLAASFENFRTRISAAKADINAHELLNISVHFQNLTKITGSHTANGMKYWLLFVMFNGA